MDKTMDTQVVLMTIGVLVVLFSVSFIFVPLPYWRESRRGKKLKLLADRYNLDYEKNYSILSLNPGMRMFFQKNGAVKRHTLMGNVNGNDLKFIDIYLYGSYSRIGRLFDFMQNTGLRARTTVYLNAKSSDQFNKQRRLTIEEIEADIKQLMGNNSIY